MKKNILNLISYSILLISVILLTFALKQVFFLMLLIPLICLPLITLYSLNKASNSLKLSVHTENESVEEDNPIYAIIQVSDRTFLPILNAVVTFRCENLFYPNEKEYRVSLPILPRKDNSVRIQLDTSHPGLVQLSMVNITLMDLLHLWKKELLTDQKTAVCVLPRAIPINFVPNTTAFDGAEEFVESDTKGNLSSEIKEIREYIPGDRLQKIHWKLSAKLDDLFVKVMEHTSTISLILLPEMSKAQLKSTLRVLFSLSDSLLQSDERFQICLYHNKTCEFEYFLINDEEHLLEMYMQLCYLPIYDSPSAALDDYKNSAQKSGILVHICGEQITLEEYSDI